MVISKDATVILSPSSIARLHIFHLKQGISCLHIVVIVSFVLILIKWDKNKAPDTYWDGT